MAKTGTTRHKTAVGGTSRHYVAPRRPLAEAALIRLRKYELRTGAGLPPAVRPYFEAIGADPDGRLGRVMLATSLYHLFSVDADWTAEHLIARLSPGQSDEAVDLWSAYGWSPTIGPDLLQAFKEPFLEFLRDRRAEDRRIGNLRGLFMTVCLEALGELTAEEIRGVVDTMSEGALKTVLGSLKHRLRGDPEERVTVWREKVHPWLFDYWPREAARNTAGTSEAILDMLAECGEAFPEAVDWSLEFLRPLDGHGLYRLGENGHAERHPDCMLRVLDRVVIADVLPIHQRHSLHEILNLLTGVDAEIAADGWFQRLFQIATS